MSSQVEIRRATAADATQIHELHTCSVKELCKDHYTPVQIDGWLKDRRPAGYLAGIEQGELFVAVEGSEIVGFGHAVPGEVLAVFVAAHRIRRGVGRSLLNYGMQLAQCNAQKTVHLKATLNAQEFYARAGFVPVEQQFVQRNDVFLPVVVMEWRSDL